MSLRIHCRTCGQRFIRVGTFLTCPNLHGRLIPSKFSSAAVKRILADGLPAVASGPKYGQHHLRGRQVRAVYRGPVHRCLAKVATDHKGIAARCRAFVDGFGVFEPVEPAGGNGCQE